MAFPTTLDDFPTETSLNSETLGTTPHAALHGNLGNAIEAIEAKVGVDSSAVTTSLDYLLKNAASSNPGHVHTVSAITDYSTAPFADTTIIVKGSVDGTKGIRFEVDGLTAGATRVLTPPDQNGTIAVLERAQTFTVGPQTIQTGAAGNKGIIVSLDASQTAAGIEIAGHPAKFHLTHPSGGRTYGVEIGSSDDGRLRFTHSSATNYLYFIVQDSPSLSLIAASGTNDGFGFQSGGTGTIAFGSDSTTSANKVKFGVRPNDEAASTAALHEFWGDTARFYHNKALTNTVANEVILNHRSSGTPAAGFGLGVHFQLQSSTTQDRDAATIEASWQTATDASRAADLIFSAYYTTTKREGIRIRATSTDVQLGFFGVTPASRPAAYTPTNVTTDRSYDANATTTDELADVLGTLIADLQSLGIVQ